MSNFSFSHSVFKSLVLHTRKNQGLFGKGLIVNVNKKFTFLNSIKELNDHNKIIEKGLIKMRREYEDEWKEDDEKIYEIVLVKSY